ncbi:tRNA acetyltransferase TAN1 [Kluyveromyces marxianus]|uniref:tRNA acetyltransferase TAN1 n=2 Tax=Kluyveromyces marxianus TaxID=4911 RepID=W0TAC9_KLUMD|nr:tRNA acetyltransferase TAN1 [Kluyveromyces marxianus DMKU3-1042]QGN15709.1 tRNA acetyltransferase TAN1 [Kluyveromyces marxianus]BAO39988.1 tRNA acetyltransferase TAN1 [Kluyveromyces marxianus DMKU3-1042]BAP71474.1 tRNA acetyltransferase TAN1 [Kluyveromyces marxianus]
MSKRVRKDSKGGSFKRYKVVKSTLDPNTSGVYISCARNRERSAASEILSILEEKIEEYYGEELHQMRADGEPESETLINDKENDNVSEKSKTEPEKELSIEEELQLELAQLKNHKTTIVDSKKNKAILEQIDLQTECLVFIKMRKPIVPEQLVHSLIKDLADPNVMQKRTRFVQKLTPVTDSCHASMEELAKLCERVIPQHFHKDNQEPLKFAVEINKRNFNTMDKMEMIKFIAGFVGKQGTLDHKVDLKNYDKLVLLQCFKNNIGMCVVDKDYRTEFKKYNIQEIFELKHKSKASEPTEKE